MSARCRMAIRIGPCTLRSILSCREATCKESVNVSSRMHACFLGGTGISDWLFLSHSEGSVLYPVREAHPSSRSSLYHATRSAPTGTGEKDIRYLPGLMIFSFTGSQCTRSRCMHRRHGTAPGRHPLCALQAPTAIDALSNLPGVNETAVSVLICDLIISFCRVLEKHKSVGPLSSVD